jgi:hypothetical protein
VIQLFASFVSVAQHVHDCRSEAEADLVSLIDVFCSETSGYHVFVSNFGNELLYRNEK